MILDEIIYYSWINKFLNRTDNIIKFHKQISWGYIIQLDLNIREIWYIKSKFKEFVEILDNILYMFNQNWNAYYKNIAFTNIRLNIFSWDNKKWEKVLNNCLYLYNSNNQNDWVLRIYWFVDIDLESKKQVKKELDLTVQIYELIKNKDLSVRNLIKLWIIQIRARKLYNFLKEKEVFIISDYNKNNKVYNFDNLNKIEENEIKAILYGAV